MHRGFTLIELLVVITIILIVSAVAIPTVYVAVSHRGISEGARILQGELVGAKDRALLNAQPAGIRLIPDPAFPLGYLPNGQIDPSQPLALSGIIPLAVPPQYTDGTIQKVDTTALPPGFVMPYPALMIADSGTGSPTNWFWNIRVGDKIQPNKTGSWYTVVGPMFVDPTQGNTELFVNVGSPGTDSPYNHLDFLWLVNGRDDNGNGYIDEGFDGLDSNYDGIIDDLAEWEPETWQSSSFASGSTYTISRRPAPTGNSRSVLLPSNVVIDLTSWSTSRERSRLPVNIYTGCVDIMVSPSGAATYNLPYSTPAAAGMTTGFYHFWLAERVDVITPTLAAQSPVLPIGEIGQPTNGLPSTYSGPRLKGDFAIVSLASQTGHTVSTTNTLFDDPAAPLAQRAGWQQTNPPMGYQAIVPFMPNMNGIIH